MLGNDTTEYEKSLLEKNLKIVNFFSLHTKDNTILSPKTGDVL